MTQMDRHTGHRSVGLESGLGSKTFTDLVAHMSIGPCSLPE